MLGFSLCSMSFNVPLSNIDVKATALGAAAALALTTMPAFAGDKDAGEAVFSANCVACHVGGQNVIMPSKTLEKAALEDYLDGGFSEAAVRKQVTNGKNAMPAFANRLSDDDIENVATCTCCHSNRLGLAWRATRSCLADPCCIERRDSPPVPCAYRSRHCHLGRGLMGRCAVATAGEAKDYRKRIEMECRMINAGAYTCKR